MSLNMGSYIIYHILIISHVDSQQVWWFLCFLDQQSALCKSVRLDRMNQVKVYVHPSLISQTSTHCFAVISWPEVMSVTLVAVDGPTTSPCSSWSELSENIKANQFVLFSRKGYSDICSLGRYFLFHLGFLLLLVH